MILHSLRTAPRLLLLMSILFFFAAYFTVSFPDMPGAVVGSFISTLIIALPSFVALWRFLGPKRAALSLLALSAFGYAVETTGVATGFPYGAFYYGDALGPKVAGLVPYLLPLSWVPLVLGAVAATVPEGKVVAGRRALWVISAAVLLTLVDGILDPGAVSLGFWVWLGSGPYYGLRIRNNPGGLSAGSLAPPILLAFDQRSGRASPPLPGLLDSVVIAVAFWVGVDLFSGLLFPAALGVALFFYLLHRRSRLAVAGEARYKGGVNDNKRRLDL